MARDEAVQVEGLGALVKALKAAEDDLGELKEANQAAARIVLDESRPRTPRRTGRLAASGRVNKAAKKASVIYGKASVPYALPIHWGWASRGIEAQPWVLKAAETSRPQWMGAYEAELERIAATVEGA